MASIESEVGQCTSAIMIGTSAIMIGAEAGVA